MAEAIVLITPESAIEAMVSMIKGAPYEEASKLLVPLTEEEHKAFAAQFVKEDEIPSQP